MIRCIDIETSLINNMFMFSLFQVQCQYYTDLRPPSDNLHLLRIWTGDKEEARKAKGY